MPRLHLIGTLVIVLLLTLVLGALFSWRSVQDHHDSLERVRQTALEQQRARLAAEMSSAQNYIEFTRSRTENVLRASLTAQVDTAMQMVEAIYARESPRRPAEEVKKLIVEALRPVRFYDGRGYYFIDDMRGKFILLPTAPRLEGKTVLENQDDTGHYIMRGLIEAARQPRGEGFSRYRWYTPEDPKKMSNKLAYVRHFAPYDWLIGTGDYTHQWEALQKQEAVNRLRGLRFGTDGYTAILDDRGHSLLSPSNPALEGLHADDMPVHERAVLEQFMALAKAGGGFTRYDWPDARTGQRIPKTALVQMARPWNWILVTSVPDGELEAALRQEMDRHETLNQRGIFNLAVALVVALAVGLGASVAFSIWSGKLFRHYHEVNAAQRQALREGEERYRTLVEWSPEAILVYRGGLVLYANPAAIALFGVPSASALVGKTMAQLVHLDFPAEPVPVASMVESKFEKYDGTVMDVEVQGTAIVYDSEAAMHISIRDVTQRKQAQAQLQLAAKVFTHAREGIMITAESGNIIDVNEAFTQITGYARADVLGKNPRILSSGRQPKEYYATMWVSLAEKGHWYGEVWNRRKNGEVFAVMQTISAVVDGQGKTQQYVSLFSDITALKAHQTQLEHIAHYDALTGLPNRVLLADRLRQGMAHASRRGKLLAVAFLDLDGFKAVNDQHGHDAGDQLLIALAARMRQALREGDTLARMGGDEFVSVLIDLPDVGGSIPMLSRLLAAAAKPVLINGVQLQVSASVGVTFFPQGDEIDADQLLRQADQAMYQAKLAGKNRYHVFDSEQDRHVRGHHEGIEAIRHALAHHELVLYFQPKVNMRTGQVMGAEALIRWQHPERGLVAPAEFLPMVEDHPLAIDIGEWVIDSALAQMSQWADAGASVPISVNVGARQLQHPDFVARLQVALARYPRVLPGELELEVLETSALEDLNGVSQVINACRALGVTFALDDFGTGYSSLTYLKRLPVAVLKIDQSFVHGMLDDPDDLAILKGVIGLASAFKRDVIAEGVETPAHAKRLLELGCECGQGYGIARPMPADALPGWVRSWKPLQVPAT